MSRAGGPAASITHTVHILPRAEKVPWLAKFLRHAGGPTLVNQPRAIGSPDRTAGISIGCEAIERGAVDVEVVTVLEHGLVAVGTPGADDHSFAALKQSALDLGIALPRNRRARGWRTAVS